MNILKYERETGKERVREIERVREGEWGKRGRKSDSAHFGDKLGFHVVSVVWTTDCLSVAFDMRESQSESCVCVYQILAGSIARSK